MKLPLFIALLCNLSSFAAGVLFTLAILYIVAVWPR